MGRIWATVAACLLASFLAVSNVLAFQQNAPKTLRPRAAAKVWLGAGPRRSGWSAVQETSPLSSTSTAAAAVAAGLSPTQRVQRLRDILFQKEALKDITAAEFALRVEIKNEASTIDYERLIFTLENKKAQQEQRGLKTSECQALVERLQRTIDELVRRKSENAEGAAAVANTQGRGPAAVAAAAVAAAAAAATSKDTAAAKLSQAVADNERLKEIQESLRVIVREDGTVDWDGAKSTGKEVARFGTELWERLNGKDESEGLPSVSEMFNPVQAKTPDTEEVLRLRGIVAQAQAALEKVLRSRDALRASLRACRKEGLEVKAGDVQSLRRLDTRVSELEKRLRIYSLDLDIERVCVYLQNELESSLEPLDQKVFVAEAALLDKQLSSIISGLALEDDLSSASASASASASGSGSGAADEETEDDRQPSSFAELSLVDSDELGLIAAGVSDLKSRLGLDTGPSMDWGSLGVLVTETAAKFRVGLSFYGDGTKLLWSDVQYAGTLLAKAVSGTTLKPREVNTIRRTGKDLLTLIPFTIILIVPLTPVGHVLVFSFIQRFFPDFFPSCYTDKRVNLLKLYTEIEMDESKGLDLGEDPVEPLSFGSMFRFPWGGSEPAAK